MKATKKIGMFLVILSMVLVFAGTASAKWYTVNVVHTNLADDGTVEIKVERNGKVQIFALPTGIENPFLATALTAQASGLQIKVEVDWAAAGSEITGMILLSETP